MTKHLVTMLVGRIVEAETAEEANALASRPFLLGAVPGVVGIALSGTRLALPQDEDGSIQERIHALPPQVKETTDAV